MQHGGRAPMNMSAEHQAFGERGSGANVAPSPAAGPARGGGGSGADNRTWRTAAPPAGEKKPPGLCIAILFVYYYSLFAVPTNTRQF
jgi:hypothetical protein